MLSRLAVVCANCNLEAERCASAAAGSRSEAEAVGSQLQGVVRPGLGQGAGLLLLTLPCGGPTIASSPAALRQKAPGSLCAYRQRG